LDWIGDATIEERKQYIAKMFDCLPADELNAIKSMASHAKARKRRASRAAARNGIAKRICSEPHFVSTPVRTGGDEGLKPWWTKWKKKDVLALDCEFVDVPKKIQTTKRISYNQTLGTIAIVNAKKEIVYEAKVYHRPGSFNTDHAHLLLTGFHKNYFKDGKPLQTVIEEVENLVILRLSIYHGILVNILYLIYSDTLGEESLMKTIHSL